MEKKVIGYTAGVFDLFHIGHINHLMNAKSMCDHLIVGISTDELIMNYKNKKTVIPYDQRVEVVRACKYVDTVISQDDFDRFEVWKKLKFDITFVGDDWFGKEKFKEIEIKLKNVGVKVIYIPYTRNISSTIVKQFLVERGAWIGDNPEIKERRKELSEEIVKKNSTIDINENSKISIIIPVYKPDKRVFNLLKEKLKKQTIPVEIIEKWNNPEPVSMNLGIKEASSDIVIILAQDCVPENEFWVEKMIKPLDNKNVVAVVSDLLLPYEEWKKRPFLSRMFTINDLKLRKPSMNLSSCAYRKKELEKIGYINENISAIDVDFNVKIRKLGKIERGNTIVYHIHPNKNYKKTLKTFYNYSKYNGISVKENKTKEHAFFQKVIRAIPFLGFASIYYRYPLKNYFFLMPIHLFFGAIIEHLINVIGFWHGFLFGEEKGKRNKEALNNKNV